MPTRPLHCLLNVMNGRLLTGAAWIVRDVDGWSYPTFQFLDARFDFLRHCLVFNITFLLTSFIKAVIPGKNCQANKENL
jgi:hypothetical protein